MVSFQYVMCNVRSNDLWKLKSKFYFPRSNGVPIVKPFAAYHYSVRQAEPSPKLQSNAKEIPPSDQS